MSTDLDIWLRDQLGHEVSAGDLTKMEALEVTAKIKAYAGITCLLLAAAQERKAHKALGYSTWVEYVEAEFDIGKSRSYQLISQAKFILELAEATSTFVDVSEAEVRDLAPAADEAKAAAVEAVESLPAESTDAEKAAAVQASLDATRAALIERNKPKATQTTTTETKVTEFDPETGEVLSTDVESAPAPKSALDPRLVMLRSLQAHRAEVAKWLAFDRHAEAIDAMTAEQRDDYRSFLLSVFNHASATIDQLDAPASLKAVQ